MAKTQAEYQKEYRARRKLTPNTNAPKTNAPVKPLVCKTCDHEYEGVGCSAKCRLIQESRKQLSRQLLRQVGPLDVYSKERWARLEAKGYIWESKNKKPPAAYKNDVWAVPAPGDPAYQGVAV